MAIKQVPKTKVKRWGRVQQRMVPIEFELLDKVSDGHRGNILKNHIGNEMRMKNSAGEVCVMKVLGSRDGFHRVFSSDESTSEYAQLIGSHGFQFKFCRVIG